MKWIKTLTLQRIQDKDVRRKGKKIDPESNVLLYTSSSSLSEVTNVYLCLNCNVGMKRIEISMSLLSLEETESRSLAQNRLNF